MFLAERTICLTASDLYALSSHYRVSISGLEVPLRANVIGIGEIDFGQQLCGISEQANAKIHDVVLSYLESRKIPDWLQQAQREFVHEVLSTIKSSEQVSYWEPTRSLSLDDSEFYNVFVAPSSSSGDIPRFRLLIFPHGSFSAEEVVGEVEILPEWFELNVKLLAGDGARIGDTLEVLNGLFKEGASGWAGKLSYCEIPEEKREYYSRLAYRLDWTSNRLLSILKQINSSCEPTSDITRHTLVRALAGTDARVALDLLGALGLKSLPMPSFRDRELVEQMGRANEIVSGQIDDVHKKINESLSRKTGFFSKLVGLCADSVRPKRDITRTWPLEEYLKLCEAIGLRPY